MAYLLVDWITLLFTTVALNAVCDCLEVNEEFVVKKHVAIDKPYSTGTNYSSMLIGSNVLKQYVTKKTLPHLNETKVWSSLHTFRHRHHGSYLLEVLRRLDSDNCLVRLLCEIASNSDDNSDSPQVRQLRAAFRGQTVPPAYENNKSLAAFLFRYAAFVGRTTGSAEVCLETFPSCTKTTEDLLSLFNEVSK